MFKNVDRGQLINIVVGILGIYGTYCLSSVLHEHLIKKSYYDDFHGFVKKKSDKAIQCPEGLILVPAALTWLLIRIYNYFFIHDAVRIPNKNSFYCGACVFASTFTYTHAVIQTSYPVVLMFKSSNILSVLMVGIFCSRVKEKKLKLEKSKLIVGAVMTVGVIFYNFFDPETYQRQQTGQIMGIGLLILSLLADGFLPDFQAEIKSVYKPQPTQMLEEVNKYVALISLFVCILNQSFWDFYDFVTRHSGYAAELFLFSFLTVLGQLFVYRIIKQFKQHIVPFIITSRKIASILISVFLVGHTYNMWQFVGVIIIFLAVSYEFKGELKKSEDKLEKFEKVVEWKDDPDFQTERSSLDIVSGSEEDDKIKT